MWVDSMGLRSILERIGQRLRLRKRDADDSDIPSPEIPRLELWELFEGLGDDALTELLDEAREDAELAAAEMSKAFRQPN